MIDPGKIFGKIFFFASLQTIKSYVDNLVQIGLSSAIFSFIQDLNYVIPSIITILSCLPLRNPEILSNSLMSGASSEVKQGQPELTLKNHKFSLFGSLVGRWNGDVRALQVGSNSPLSWVW